MPRLPGFSAALLALLVSFSKPCKASAETGFQPDVRVRQSTRLDWEFVAGEEAARLPASYDSRHQRYQLFVPKDYAPTRAWPLILFLSPGDDPLGWKSWEKVCQEKGLLFCAAYGAGNGAPLARRVRTVLDVLDDVRRSYQIDPDRTYLAGLGGGGEVACALAFALPELFGGVVAVEGAEELPARGYLRKRVRERLSLALVVGERGPARRSLENFHAPLYRDLGVRARVWGSPGAHALPGEDVLLAICNWLEEDLERRQKDTKFWAALAASPDGVVPHRLLAARALELGEGELKKPGKLLEAVALLEWALARCPRTESAEKIRAVLAEIQADPRRKAVLAEQAGAEERSLTAARARALERAGQIRSALGAWQALARTAPGDEGKRAQEEARRLVGLLARTPYLGAAFEPGGLTVREVVAGSPAMNAGLKSGDRIIQIGGVKVASLAELRELLGKHRPGKRLPVTVRREGKAVELTVELGKVDVPGG